MTVVKRVTNVAMVENMALEIGFIVGS
jgi:hypothetical protein